MVREVGLEGEEVARESNRVGICDTFNYNLVLRELVQESRDKYQVNSVFVGDLKVGFVEFFGEILHLNRSKKYLRKLNLERGWKERVLKWHHSQERSGLR